MRLPKIKTRQVSSLLSYYQELFSKFKLEENIVELVLSRILNKAKFELYLVQDLKLTYFQKLKFIKILRQVFEKNLPVQYLLGVQNFYGYDFKVNRNVLIPRFTTELMIDLAKSLSFSSVLDMCTGSGCIGLTLKKELPSARVLLLDISKKALKVAKQNSKNLQADVLIVQSDLFEKITTKFDLITANPPYLTNGEYVSKNVNFEPKIALYAEENGFAVIKKILSDFPKYLNPGGHLILEISPTHEKLIEANLPKGFKVEFHLDERENARFALISEM